MSKPTIPESGATGASEFAADLIDLIAHLRAGVPGKGLVLRYSAVKSPKAVYCGFCRLAQMSRALDPHLLKVGMRLGRDF